MRFEVRRKGDNNWARMRALQERERERAEVGGNNHGEAHRK
jgi:hypothetical protein